MADTQRSRAQILVLFADNSTGNISPQDLRDYVVTVMEEEFVNAGDFWSQPQSRYTTTDKDARGWILYSQYMQSAVSFANIVRQDQSGGGWGVYDAVEFSDCVLGLPLDSYAAGESQAQVLLKGCVYQSAWSTTFSRLIGKAVYAASGASGSITMTPTSYMRVVGWVMPSTHSLLGSAIGKFFFDPHWAVILR